MSKSMSEIMNGLNDRRKSDARNLTLGSLVNKLEGISNPKATVYFDWCGCLPKNFHSYRGYYEDLAITFASEGSPETVEKFLARCRAEIGATHTGWKGGEFEMDKSTLLWVSETGRSTGWGLVDVDIKIGHDGQPYSAILKTAYCESW